MFVGIFIGKLIFFKLHHSIPVTLRTSLPPIKSDILFYFFITRKKLFSPSSLNKRFKDMKNILCKLLVKKILKLEFLNSVYTSLTLSLSLLHLIVTRYLLLLDRKRFFLNSGINISYLKAVECN